MVADSEGRIVMANPAAQVMTRLAPPDVRREEWSTAYGLYCPDMVTPYPSERLPLWRAIDGETVHDVEIFVRNEVFPQGQWHSCSAAPLRDPEGRPSGGVLIFHDITARKRAQDELRRTADTLRAVIQTSPLAIVGMDLDGTVKSWNRAAERMFGWRSEEVVGQRFPIIPEEDEEFFRVNQERLRFGETIAGVERQRRRKDGTLIDVALWNAPQRDGAGRVVGAISVIADVSERKRLEEQFLQSQKMEAVGRLAGGVAHDFNNLLTVISGYTQMLFEEMPADDPTRDYVTEIVRAAESATTLTDQLLAFSRRQIVSPRVIDLNELVSGVDKMVHRLIGEDIELKFTLAPKLPKVKIDSGQFQQVVLNLVVNARDAMPEGGTISIETSTMTVGENHADGVAPGAYVVLSVVDSGKGMTEEVRKRAFEPFFTTKGRGKGTGLGLSTVYGIVKQAGGDITIASEPGEGATFRMYLPSVDEAVAAGVETPGASVAKTGTETVLVVEDDAGLRRLVTDVLSNHGYTVLAAADFRAALEFCEAHAGPVHLLLTDLVLPGMSGSELAGRAQALRPKLKVLLMSGYTDRAGLDEPMHPFLQKPFTPETLLTRMRQLLDSGDTIAG
jgi:two-component system cell cycle sensor histidine kinase/response regulator CckA